MSLQSRYTILRKIADGGTAEIFLAKQHGAQGFEKMVVLKRILSALYADPQFRHLLVDEAHVAMSLSHSNIVQVLDLGEADGRYFLALELVDGWTLDKVLRRAKAAGVPFPPALALYVTAEVCRALGYAHGKRRDGKPLEIVHRDISPHNVLLSAEGEVKLTDFGIAKAQNKKEQSLGKLIKGKIAFMSPEQASGGDLDARSDLFSAGTMLYVMITRRLPFDAPTDYETLMQVKGGDYLPPETARPGLNPELYRVIRKAMEKSAADRYQKADEMLVDVEQVMRLAFRPVGQTELQRWLSDLTTKDGVPALTREAPATVVSGPPSTVGPLAVHAGGVPQGQPTGRPSADSGRVAKQGQDRNQDSGLILDLADAVEVSERAGEPPPPPSSAGSASAPMAAATEVMMSPPSFSWAEPWYKRRGPRIGGGVALVLVLALSAKALMRDGRPAEQAPAPMAKGEAPAPSAAAAPTPPTAAAANPEAAQPAVAAAAPTPAATDAAAAAPAPAAAPEAPPVVAERAPEVKAAAPAGAPAEAAEPDQAAGDAADERDGDGDGDDDAAAARGRTVSVVVKSDPAGSKVSTRHHNYGTTPASLKLRAGSTYELTFTKSGYLPASKRYRVTEKSSQLVRVALKKEPAPARHAAAAKTSAKPTAPPRAQKPTAGQKPAAAQNKSAPATEPHPTASAKKKDNWFSR